MAARDKHVHGLQSTCQHKGSLRSFRNHERSRGKLTTVVIRQQPKQQIFFPKSEPKQNSSSPRHTFLLALSSSCPLFPLTNFPHLPNAPIHQNPPPILLPPPPPPQMASRLGFNLARPRLFTAQIRKPFFSASSLPSSAPGAHSLQFGANKLTFRRRLLLFSPKATSEQPGQVQEGEVVDSNVLPYCSLDQKQKKSIGEMEQEFLQALQAFYYEGKSIMSNEEFDNLKEELMWEGSSVVMLSADEQRFLEASMAYVSGQPIMSDEEFDNLKQKLKNDGSEIVVEGPRCSLRSKKVYSDLSVDYLKMFLLNVPAAVVALGLFFFLDDLTGFEITYLLEILSLQLPEPFSFLFTWFAALPFILWLSFTITSFIVKDFLILVGPCPNCGTENTSFFGTILSVSNGGVINNVKCSNCGTDMVYDSKTRLITLPEGGQA